MPVDLLQAERTLAVEVVVEGRVEVRDAVGRELLSTAPSEREATERQEDDRDESQPEENQWKKENVATGLSVFLSSL